MIMTSDNQDRQNKERFVNNSKISYKSSFFSFEAEGREGR